MIAFSVVERDRLDFDTCLMLEVQKGSEVAFEQIFARHHGWVGRYLASASDADQAEDLTQEVFLRVYRSREGYQPTAKFSTWLFTIVSNVAKNSIRKSARCRVFPVSRLASCNRPSLSESVYAPRFESPESCFREKELYQRLRQALGLLNRRQKRALRMYALDGYSYDQIADEMGISSQAVKSLMARARSNLSSYLNTAAAD